MSDMKKFTNQVSSAKNMFMSRKIYIAIFCILILSLLFVLHQMLSQSTEILADSKDLSSNAQPYVFHTESSKMIKLETKFSGEKLVHLDLKGAPPLISHLEQMFPIFRKMGATGLLIEYEDMFPYSSKLNISALNAYSHKDIKKLLASAAANNLTVIPLIQTFGHLEFVLKLEEYNQLRESNMFPQVICPTHERSLPFIHAMIDEVVALHTNVKYLHIGCDEVYYLGQCNRCRELKEKNQWTQSDLFLYHVRNVVSYIKEKYPQIRPIMWDDEFRGIEKEEILNAKLADMVDLMIWKYAPEVQEYITDAILEKYSQVFSGIWIASAFKGATGPTSMLPDVRYHLQNHQSWMEVVKRWEGKMQVKGIAITGWQRYDHFALLCELLPVAIPSLAVCLQYLDGHAIDDNVLSPVLQCTFPFSWAPGEESSAWANYRCTYPGSTVYHLVNSLYMTLNEIQNSKASTGWFSWYQTVHNFSNPAHVMSATNMLNQHKARLTSLEVDLRRELSSVYDNHTIDEWIASFISPISIKLKAAAKARDQLLDQTNWPRRPFNRQGSDRRILNGVCDDPTQISCTLLGFV